MTEQQIVSEILRYINDNTYNYAVLIDGEWGCGKTYFAKNVLSKAINEQEQSNVKPRSIKYISLYGCKTIDNVQENIAWNFAENAQAKIRDAANWGDKADTIVGNVVNTSRKIGNIILKKYLPEASLYEITAEWLDLGAYIYIVDDLERCECSINEVFGFFNELVEHANTKVIFLANEKEIVGLAESKNLELQYMLSLSQEIEWPKKEDNYFSRLGSNHNDKINIDEIERRRSLLFPRKEANVQYRKVKEKVIGETLKYVPNLKNIIPNIISSISCADDIKELIASKQEYYLESMRSYMHCNLRTFQFYLSKVGFLLAELEKIKEIDEEYKGKIQNRVMDDVFLSSIKHKSNYISSKTGIELIIHEQKVESVLIKEYVENGKYDFALFKGCILAIQDELFAIIDLNDPFNVVFSNFYLKTQKECEEALKSLSNRIEENRYPISLYAKIIMGVQKLIDIGFSPIYMDNIKQAMLGCVETSNEVNLIDSDLWYVDDKDYRERVLKHIDDINLVIENRSNKSECSSIQRILQEDNWVNRLEEYLNPEEKQYFQDRAVFSKAPTEMWILNIKAANPKIIDDFRRLLGKIYPRDVHRKSFEMDKDSLMSIRNQIKDYDEEDIIKKICVKWLISQLDAIIENNKSDFFNV
ncbi:MAG: KAP family NTPase [Lachnospiraceae bacterium]|nr:KAP family NTPase [Lachnospiraceae bacterium]